MRRRLRSRPLLAALAACGVALCGSAPGPTMPGPAPISRARRVDNAECERCHADIAAEWRQSLHSTAFTDADFQRALPRDPEAFCTNCHAPERDPRLGVACVTCHVPGGDVLAAPSSRPGPRAPGEDALGDPAPVDAGARPPHAVVRTPDFGGVAACARCHEFDFPDAKLRRTPLAMQRTVSEHRGRSDTCQTCHMTKRGGHTDHRFSASRDEAFVKSAVTVRARRASETSIEVTLAPAMVGHAFPTGDLFRRVRVSAGRSTRYLSRHYASRQELPGIVVRSEVADDRVLGGERLVVLEAPREKVPVRVVYERAEGMSDATSSTATVAGSIELFAAEL